MKRKIALFVSALLLCGCADGTLSGAPDEPTSDIPDIIPSAEVTAEPPEEDLQTAPAPIETAEAEEPETEFDDTDWIAPRLSPEKVDYTFSDEFAYKDIAEYVKKSAGAVLEEYGVSGEYQTHDRLYYIGTDDADWLIVVSYTLPYNQRSLLERLFLIKDGGVAREFAPVKDWIYGITYSRGELFVSCMSGGLLRTDIASGGSALIAESVGNVVPMVTAVNDGYVVFREDDRHRILVRETGEIIDTDIQWHYMADNRFILSGDKIDYMDTRGEPCGYDIPTRTLTRGDFHNLAKIKGYMYNDKWSVTRLTAPDGTELPAVEAVNLRDGSERVYDLRALNGDADISKVYFSLKEEGSLWIDIAGGFGGVLNLETGEAAAADFGGWESYPDDVLEEGKLSVIDFGGGAMTARIADVISPV